MNDLLTNIFQQQAVKEWSESISKEKDPKLYISQIFDSILKSKDRISKDHAYCSLASAETVAIAVIGWEHELVDIIFKRHSNILDLNWRKLLESPSDDLVQNALQAVKIIRNPEKSDLLLSIYANKDGEIYSNWMNYLELLELKLQSYK